MSILRFLIYSERPNNRLKYISDWLFSNFSNAEANITNDREEFLASKDIRIDYSHHEETIDKVLKIKPSGLLESIGSDTDEPKTGQLASFITLYPCSDNHYYPFDVFSACFYCLSRYEEYSKSATFDAHGRYEYKNSIAFKNNFLETPIVDIWLFKFRKDLEEKFNCKILTNRNYKLKVSFDIDTAFKYKGKGLIRNIWGFSKDSLTFNKQEVIDRYSTLTNRLPDPYDCFKYVDELKEKFKFDLQYFFLIGDFGEFDRNISHRNNAFRKLIKRLADYDDVAIHLSYKALNNQHQIQEEIERLQKITLQLITKNRNHYVRFQLPKSLMMLEQAGITEDYTMGYPDKMGFRAGTTNSFKFFNLHENRSTNLTIHPFSIMDATAIYYMKESQGEFLEQMQRIANEVKNVNGYLSCVWHNHFFNFSKEKRNIHWKSLFEKFIKTNYE